MVQPSGGALLDAWMGTGKTRLALELAGRVGARRTLVVAPLAVVSVWPAQAALYAPTLRVLALDRLTVGRRAEALARALADPSPLLVAVNYDAVWRPPLKDMILKVPWDLLIPDEAHRMKSPGGVTSRFLAGLAKQCRRRLGLTGTPMPHSPLDIYGVMRTLDPSVFGWSFVQFRSKYAVLGGFNGKIVRGFQNLDELRARLATRTVSIPRDVLTLPPALHHRIPVTLSPKARKAYDDLERDLIVEIEEGTVTVANAMVSLLRLAQLTGGCLPVDERDGPPVRLDESKMDALETLLDGLPADEPVVVFCRFVADLDAVHAVCRALDRKSLELSGRRKELAEWQAGAAPVLAVQIQAGGLGVDATRACYCIWYSASYSLGDHDQANARLHRPGQTRAVHYYHLVATGTVDESVYASLQRKGKVVEDVLGALRARHPKGATTAPSFQGEP